MKKIVCFAVFVVMISVMPVSFANTLRNTQETRRVRDAMEAALGYEKVTFADMLNPKQKFLPERLRTKLREVLDTYNVPEGERVLAFLRNPSLLARIRDDIQDIVIDPFIAATRDANGTPIYDRLILSDPSRKIVLDYDGLVTEKDEQINEFDRAIRAFLNILEAAGFNNAKDALHKLAENGQIDLIDASRAYSAVIGRKGEVFIDDLDPKILPTEHASDRGIHIFDTSKNFLESLAHGLGARLGLPCETNCAFAEAVLSCQTANAGDIAATLSQFAEIDNSARSEYGEIKIALRRGDAPRRDVTESPDMSAADEGAGGEEIVVYDEIKYSVVVPGRREVIELSGARVREGLADGTIHYDRSSDLFVITPEAAGAIETAAADEGAEIKAKIAKDFQDANLEYNPENAEAAVILDCTGPGGEYLKLLVENAPEGAPIAAIVNTYKEATQLYEHGKVGVVMIEGEDFAEAVTRAKELLDAKTWHLALARVRLFSLRRDIGPIQGIEVSGPIFEIASPEILVLMLEELLTTAGVQLPDPEKQPKQYEHLKKALDAIARGA